MSVKSFQITSKSALNIKENIKHQSTAFSSDDRLIHQFCDITCGVPQGSVLGPILFLLFINDISNFAVEGCALNMYADDVIIYTSATSKDELESRLQVCIDNISNWYSMNKLCINKKKSNVMVIGSKWQLKSLNLDDFTISVDSDKLFLASQAKYLGLWVRNDLSWDDHILELCRKMYYYFHMFRRLRKILPSALLLNIYKTYVHSCSKVMGFFFAVAKYGVYFLGTDLKFCVWHKEVFCIHNGKYLKCMIYRHAWVNIQIW